MPASAAASSSSSASASGSSASASQTEEPAQNKKSDVVSTQDIAIYSKSACVMDADTGQVLYYKNPMKKRYPASITKILTALLLIENSKLSDQITFTEDCWTGIDRWSDMNVAMQDGEILTVEQALYCILLVSANEVCNQAGIQVAGSVDGFVQMMNDKAASLGCTRTHFVTANGLHDKQHYTTAYDMALISRAAIQNETFRTVTGTSYYKITTNLRPEGFELYHKHQMIAADSWHDDQCIGGKTGYTPQAHNTLVTYMKSGDVTLVCVVLDNNNGHIYSDTKTVCQYCFDNYDRTAIDNLAASDAGKAINKAAGTYEGSSSETQSSEQESTSSGEALTLQGEETANGTPASSSDEQSSVSEPLTAKRVFAAIGSFFRGVGSFFSDPKTHLVNWGNRLMQAFFSHMPMSFFILLGCFLVLILVIIWIRGVIHRGIHRRRYKKMRKKNRRRGRKS